MENKEYAKKVKEMRAKQNQYFKAVKAKVWATAQAHLKESKALEAEVDKLTEEILTGVSQSALF